MEMHWRNMNADLSKLCEFIKEFFRGKEFDVSVGKFDDHYRIVVKPRKLHEMVGNVLVIIEGEPNDFYVKMTLSNLSRSLTFLGSILSFLGFGFLAVKGYKSEEKFEKLEREFKAFIAEKVWKVSRIS